MIKYLHKNSFLYSILLKIYLTLHRACIWIAWQLFSQCPVQKHKIVFSNFNGNGFSDNTRYIAEEFLRRKLPFDLYWVCSKPECKFPPGLKIIRPDSISFVFHMSTAAVWVDNTRKLYYFKKKKKQIYIHTWHAGPGLKKIEKDAENGLSAKYISYAKKDSKNIDLLITNSRFWTQCFRSCFWYHGPIMETGLPKNDLYFRDRKKLQKVVKEYYQLPEETNLVLYVPTWRENRKLNVYHLDFESCLDAFEQRFGGKWVMLVRLHPNVNAEDFDIHYNKRVKNASPYDNVQELLAAGDAVITDYSSCGFDYIQLDRPSFLYAEDYEEMRRDKGYYLELDEVPTPKAFDNQKMIQNILNFSEEQYEKERKTFMKKMGYVDDGNASKRVVDTILNLMQQRS